MTDFDDKTTLDQDVTAGDVRRAASLVLYEESGVRAVPLEEGRAVVVGRSVPADVVVDHMSLSRQHARIVWKDGVVRLEDLGSRNGTLVRGERSRGEVRLGPGEPFQLGAITASINVASGDARLRGVIGHERFLARLEDEVVRARGFKRPLAVAMIRAIAREGGEASRWLPRVRGALRPVDALAVYGPSAVLLLLPECDRDVAARTVSAIVAARVLGEPPLVAGVATFPEAASVDELVEVARKAARRAVPSSPVALAEVGEPSAERSVVVLSPAMRDLYQLVRKVAGTSVATLVVGETGTGKDVVARAIHSESSRRSMPLRSINCGAIPSTLLESVLFGHEKGAFTGAEQRAPGLFEQANGGTVFLDEVAELSPPAQAALLRVLETKRFSRVGGTEEVEVDVRVVAATHRDLEKMVEAGAFRLDLLYRLNTMVLRVPPLRERAEEIDALADLFLEEARVEAGTAARAFDPGARALLRSYAWPGNVRELRNVIERAVLVCSGELIGKSDLGERLARPSVPPLSDEEPTFTSAAAGDFKDRVQRYETELILDALKRSGGNQTQAAKVLGMPLRTLVHKMKSYGIRKLYSEGDA